MRDCGLGRLARLHRHRLAPRHAHPRQRHGKAAGAVIQLSERIVRKGAILRLVDQRRLLSARAVRETPNRVLGDIGIRRNRNLQVIAFDDQVGLLDDWFVKRRIHG